MKPKGNLGRSVCRAGLAALVWGGLFAASAGAKTVKVGQLFTPNFTCSPGRTALQTGVASGPSYTVPKAGVITSWSWHDGVNIVPKLRLKVGRPTGTANTYKIVGQDTAGTQTPNTVHTYSAHIPVRAGDLIGVYQHGGSCLSITGNAGDTDVETSGNIPPGTTRAFLDGGSDIKWPVSAKIALDCVVPNLKGKTLKSAKKSLKANSCTLGTVKGPRNDTVKSQKPAAGKTLAPGAKVNVRLG
jgi:hypothetical protein